MDIRFEESPNNYIPHGDYSLKCVNYKKDILKASFNSAEICYGTNICTSQDFSVDYGKDFSVDVASILFNTDVSVEESE